MSPMTLAPLVIFFSLLLGFGYLRVGRSVAMKRWLLPLWTAGIAALTGLLLARSGDGSIGNYAVAVPLGLSLGLLLQHVLDYCRTCGAPLRFQMHRHEAAAHRSGRVTSCCGGHEPH